MSNLQNYSMPLLISFHIHCLMRLIILSTIFYFLVISFTNFYIYIKLIIIKLTRNKRFRLVPGLSTFDRLSFHLTPLVELSPTTRSFIKRRPSTDITKVSEQPWFSHHIPGVYKPRN